MPKTWCPHHESSGSGHLYERSNPVALLVLNVGTGSVLGAQSRSNAFTDLTVGSNFQVSNFPINGEYYEAGQGFAFLAFGSQQDENRSLEAALHFGLFAVLGGDDACDLTPLGGCYRDYPFGDIIAITVGARPLTSPWRAFELTAGPAVVGLLDGRGTTYGALTVGRIGLPPGRYLSPGLALHGFVAPIDGTFVFAAGFGFSLRTW